MRLLVTPTHRVPLRRLVKMFDPASHSGMIFLHGKDDVDGRAKPGHDENRATCAPELAPMGVYPRSSRHSASFSCTGRSEKLNNIASLPAR